MRACERVRVCGVHAARTGGGEGGGHTVELQVGTAIDGGKGRRGVKDKWARLNRPPLPPRPFLARAAAGPRSTSNAPACHYSSCSPVPPCTRPSASPGNAAAAGAQVHGLSRMIGLLPPRSEDWIESPVSSKKGCSAAQLRALRQQLDPYDRVGVQTFHGLVFGSHWLSGPPECQGNVCCEAFKRVCKMLHKSQTIYALAQSFIDK